MASKDSTIELYDGEIELEYRDKSHRYFVSERLHHGDDNWTKPVPVKGVTTIMDAVLEKKGLMLWPMGLALRELFGFYDFKNENGVQLTGFSKGVGTMWDMNGEVFPYNQTLLQPLVLSASKAWQRTKKTGADIGSIVHEAIEAYVTKQPFTIDLASYKTSQEFASDVEEYEWDKTAVIEVEKAQIALESFRKWWDAEKPELVGAEQLVYSRRGGYAGSYDAILRIKDRGLVLSDNKTSNASASTEAAAPEGVYYSYFIQLGGYADAYQEMTGTMPDDLLTISCRKDGEFSLVYASDLGLSVQDCIDWWRGVLVCYRFMVPTKKALINKVKEKE